MAASILTNEVQGAFEEMKKSLRKKRYSESIIDAIATGVAKGLLPDMFSRLNKDDQKYFIDMIRNMYKPTADSGK